MGMGREGSTEGKTRRREKAQSIFEKVIEKHYFRFTKYIMTYKIYKYTCVLVLECSLSLGVWGLCFTQGLYTVYQNPQCQTWEASL